LIKTRDREDGLMKFDYRLHRRMRVIRRYRQIIEVLVKYGFGEILGRMNITPRLRIGKRRFFAKATDLASRNYAERIRMAMEELGPTFIKLGQVLSTRPFLIPVDLVVELTKLQDEVPPFEFAQVKKIIEKELKTPLSEIFETLDEKPVASASLAQVHIGVLRDGRKVAVKVQRPGVKDILDVDMVILRDLANLMERFIPESKRFDPSGQIDELSKVSRRECDFLYEARNMEIFSNNFAEDETVKIPDVYWEVTTTRVLICEYIDGIKISSVKKLEDQGINLSEVAHNGLRAILKMIFEDRFFHGDPHPGNVFVMKDGRIALLDFGMVGHVSESVVDFLVSLLFSASSWDARRILKTVLEFNLVPEDYDQMTLESDLTELLYRYHKIPLWQIDMKALLIDSMDIFYRHDVKLPGSFMLLTKAMITAEEVARALDPKINIIEEIEPYIKNLTSKRFRYTTFKHDLASTLGDLRELVTDFPFDLKRITQKLRRGEIEFQFHHRGLEDLTSELFQSSKRVSLALIIAAILVSASLLRHAGAGIRIFGFPLLSMLGFFVGGVLTIWLIINILRSPRN
jgi:ubiquinone biosynthesis protein